jgi:hypothetical protein
MVKNYENPNLRNYDLRIAGILLMKWGMSIDELGVVFD